MRASFASWPRLSRVSRDKGYWYGEVEEDAEWDSRSRRYAERAEAAAARAEAATHHETGYNRHGFRVCGAGRRGAPGSREAEGHVDQLKYMAEFPILVAMKLEEVR